MPAGTPTPAQLWHGEITFFSLDTDVIQGAGYNFEAGALNQLHKQLPSTMELQLTDIVANEVVNHLMEPVLKNIQELNSAAANLKRKADLPMEQIIDLFRGLDPAEASRIHFRQRVETYASGCRGGILAVEGDGVLTELFRSYFAVDAPFGLRTTKKSEFPDAASLLLLEAHAKESNSMGVAVSIDGGWHAFAEKSEYLYCVRSLDELTTLFAATGEVAGQIHELIRTALEDHNSPLRSQLADALESHVNNASWDVGDISSDTGDRVEGEVSEVRLADHELLIENTEIWNDEDDPTTWLVEVTALVKVDVTTSITTFLWDSIDRDEVAIDSDYAENLVEIEVTAFVTCSDVQADSDPESWSVEVEIASEEYSVDVGEVSAFPWEED